MGKIFWDGRRRRLALLWWGRQKRSLTEVFQKTILYTNKVGKEPDVLLGERIALFLVTEE